MLAADVDSPASLMCWSICSTDMLSSCSGVMPWILSELAMLFAQLVIPALR